MSVALIAGRRERVFDHVGDHGHRVLEHFAAFHPQMADGLGRGRAAVDIELGACGGRRSADAWSGCRGRCIGPGCSWASSTTAPAPSPNSTQVVRSFQSRMREKVSAPITSARLCEPRAQQAVGDGERIDKARAHRLQVEGRALGDAERGLHRRPRSPGRCGRASRCRRTIRSIDCGIDAGMGERGLRRLGAEIRGEFIVGAAIWRSRMPVRCTIHSSVVSTVLRQLGIGQNARRKIAAAAQNDGTHQCHEVVRSPPARRPALGARASQIEGHR